MTIILGSTGLIFAIFHCMKALCVQMFDLDLFSDISRDVAMATNFVAKSHTSHICTGSPKRNSKTCASTVAIMSLQRAKIS